MSDFLMATSGESLELLEAIADEMVSQFSLARAEAVARINDHWRGQDLSSENEVILHEDEYYWALWIYYGGKCAIGIQELIAPPGCHAQRHQGILAAGQSKSTRFRYRLPEGAFCWHFFRVRRPDYFWLSIVP